MKKITILCVFQVIIILLLSACSNDTTPIHSAKVLIYGRAESCLIIINENGTVDYISCQASDVNIYDNEDTIKDFYKFIANNYECEKLMDKII